VPGPFVPTDTLVGPIIHQLALVSQQIQGMGRTYEVPPEGLPEDNSVLFPLKKFRVLDDTNAKLKVELDFSIYHLFRRDRMEDTYPRIQPFLTAWWFALADWQNLTLGGLAILTTIKDGSIGNVMWGDQPYLAVITNITVLTEFNIPLT
jgi:hypothetical protein